jgi:hypothetical protein
MTTLPKVTLNNLNLQLSNLTNLSNSGQVQTAGSEIASQFQSVSTTKIGLNVNEVVGGWQGLTQEVDNIGDDNTSVSNKGLALLTDQPPGVNNLITPLSSGAQNDLKSITGLDADISGGLNTVVHALPTPEAVGDSLKALSNLPFNNLQSAINAVAPEATQGTAATNTISNLTNKVNGLPSGLSQQFGQVVGAISSSLNSFLDQGFGQIIKDIIQANTNSVGNALSRLTRDSRPLNKSLQKQIISLIDAKNFKEAAVLLSPYSDLSLDVLEKELSEIDTSANSMINKFNPELDAFGTSSSSIFPIGALDSLWKGADTVPTPISPYSTPVPDIPASVNQSSGYSFTFISSMEELEAELRSASREITETVIHWTANFIDQPYIGSEQIHEVHKQRGFSGIGYHYIIRRDGRIQRGRPINQEGAHAKDYGHNNYSIGISHVAGYNCVSGTPGPNRYISSESISDPQWAAQKAFLEVFYRVFPAGQVLGHYQCSDLGKVDPGFDVDDYILNTFGKRNLVRFNNNFGPFSRSELASAISTLS